MFIHKVNEGERFKLGLNWHSSENTLFKINLLIPIWLVLPNHYNDFDTDNNYYSWRIRILYFRFCIRRWKNFPSNVQKVCWNFHSGLRSIGKQHLISTVEMHEDNKC